jgi:hypothetical protein
MRPVSETNLTTALNSALAGAMPVTDAEAAQLASPAAFDDLSGEITAQPVGLGQPRPASRPLPASGRWRLRPRGRRGPGRPWTRRRALLAGLPLAALAGAAALVIGLLLPTGGSNGNGADSPAAIQALSFTTHNGYINVVIRNLYADTAWYNADLARHHLDVKIQLTPVSPGLVGTLVAEPTAAPGIVAITGTRSCYAASAGTQEPCPIGFRVPENLHDPADLVIGRPARPGEQYTSTGSIFAPGEALAGQLATVAGQPMSQVSKILASHHLAIAICRDKDNKNVSPSSVPGTDYLTDIQPLAPGQVIIWTSPTRFYGGSERAPGVPAGIPGGGH